VNTPFTDVELARIRADFPVLDQKVHGKPLVYLDSAASTQKPRAVIDAVSRLYAEDYANVHRGVYQLAERATRAFEAGRDAVRRLLHAPEAREVVLLRGTTEAINLVASSWGRANVGPGDEILITAMEHHSNIVPWQMLCAAVGAKLVVAPIDDDGALELDELERRIGPRTRLVAVVHVSNALGTVNPVREITEIAHAAGARVLVDGAQAVARDAGGRGRDRLRLLRVLRAQALRAVRDRGAVGPRGAARGDAAVAGRRRDDRVGELREDHLREDPAQVRGGDAAHRRRRRARHRGGVPGGGRRGARRRPRGRAARLRHRGGAFRPGAAPDRHGAGEGGSALLRDRRRPRPRRRHDPGPRGRGGARRPPLRAAGDAALRRAATVRASFGIYNSREDVDALVRGLHAVVEMFA
jgi:hypothetical protein